MILKDENLAADVDVDTIAELSVNFSGSDLHELCRCAAMNSFIEHIKQVNGQGDAAQSSINQNSAILIKKADFDAGFEKMSVKNLTSLKNRFNLSTITDDSRLD